MSNERWVLLRTEPRRELFAQTHLHARNTETFLPMIIGNRGNPVVMFPSYIFAWVGDFWYYLKTSFGINSIIMRGEVPDTVPIRVIDNLKLLEKDGVINLPENPKLRKGQLVTAISGFFVNEIGIYQGQVSHERICALFSYMGRMTSVYLPAKMVSPVKELTSR